MEPSGADNPTQGRGLHLATLIHLTDLHLLCDSNGVGGTVFDLSKRIGKLVALGADTSNSLNKTVREGCGVQDEDAWQALRPTLEGLVAAEHEASMDGAQGGVAAPVMVVQTGDVTTFGLDVESAGRPTFPEFHYLQDHLWPQLRSAGAAACVDLFGNHDIWPGSYQLTGSRHRFEAVRELSRLATMSGPWPDRWPRPSLQLPGGCRLDLVRLNTATIRRWRGAIAAGVVEPYPAARRVDVFRELRDCFASATGEGGRAIRVVLLHHPPHPFETSVLRNPMKSVGTRALYGAKQLSAALQAAKVHLVIGGHRHDIDPDEGSLPINGGSAVQRQEPLPARTVQLVASTPTQVPFPELRGTSTPLPSRNSFSVYRIYLEANQQAVAVTRRVYNRSVSKQFPVDEVDDEPVARSIPL